MNVTQFWDWLKGSLLLSFAEGGLPQYCYVAEFLDSDQTQGTIHKDFYTRIFKTFHPDFERALCGIFLHWQYPLRISEKILSDFNVCYWNLK